MPKINDNVVDALEKAVEYYGNVSQLSKKMGIAHSTILFWMSGKTRNISGRLWISKIRPVLMPFMSKNAIREMVPPTPFTVAEPMAEYERIYNMENEGYATGSSASVLAAPSQVQVQTEIVYKENKAHVITFDALLGFDPMLDQMEKFVRSNSIKKTIFAHEVKPGYFALVTDEKSPCFSFPYGTYLLVAGTEFAQNYDTVIARIRSSGDIVVRTYFRDGTKIKLMSRDASEETIEWDTKESPGFLFWMYPLMEANLNLKEEKKEERDSHRNEEPSVETETD